jgi:F-type H+-transporting ATPase subunit delta
MRNNVEQQGLHDTVFDTGAEHLGSVYADALLRAADKAGIADTAVEQLEAVVSDVINQHPDLAEAFASPRVSVDEKSRILDSLFGSQLHPVVLRFLKVVAGRGRLGYVRNISSSARALRDETLGRQIAQVTSAVPLDDTLRQQVIDRLSASLNKQVVLREKIDPSLVGGLVIRIGDTVYDSSVAGRLTGMAKKTQKAFARKLMENSERFSGKP